MNFAATDLDKLAIVVDKLTETIEKVHEVRLKEEFKKASI